MLSQPVFSRKFRFSFFWAMLCLFGSLRIGPGLAAQEPGPKSSGMKVRWTDPKGDHRGELSLNPQEKKLRLVDERGQLVPLVDKLNIQPETPAFKKTLVGEQPSQIVAIAGYQERLTGHIIEVDGNQLVSWNAGQSQEPLKWPSGLAAAWAIHPSRTVLGYARFSEADQANGVTSSEATKNEPSGFLIKSEVSLKPEKIGYLGDYTRVVQCRFYEKTDSTLVDGLQLKIQGAGEPAEKSLQIQLNSNGEQWQVQIEREQGFVPTAIPRKPGWHWLTLVLGTDRTRVCVDESVVAESRQPLLAQRGIDNVTIAAGSESKRLISEAGVYLYGAISAPVQRSLEDDLIQFHAGHEWIGRLATIEKRSLNLDFSGNEPKVNLGLIRTWLPRRESRAGRWVLGPVIRLTMLQPGKSMWDSSEDKEYYRKLGLLQPPAEGLDCIEGVVESISVQAVTVGLSQGGQLQVNHDQIVRIEPLNVSGMRVIDARPHHLGDTIDTKVIPFEPEGRQLMVQFPASEAELSYQTVLAIDALDVLGFNNTRFAELLKKGELVTEIWLNGNSLGTLNSHITGTNEIPERLMIDVPAKMMKAGTNQLELRQIGRENDENYLDDLSILGIRLMRKD